MMLPVYLYKCQSQTLIVKHLSLNNLRLFFRSYTTKLSDNPTNVDFKISFLKDKCGLSGKSLIRASKCLDFDSSHQTPEGVLELFRNFGFPQSTISKIVSNYPFILRNYHPQQVIKPKLDFLLSISQSRADVVAIVTRTPRILSRSLTKHLIPSFTLLNSVTGSYLNTVSVLKRNPYILSQNVPKSFLLNTQFLLALGVPHPQILKLLRCYAMVLGSPHDKLCNVALKLKDMGFDLSSSYFLQALYTLTFIKNSTWDSRCVLFRSFGFSNQEILSMFMKLPYIMCSTDKNLSEKIEFFFNKLQWTPLRLSSNPSVLSYSLKKRTIPRCSVLQVLVSKKSTSKCYMLSSVLAMTEEKFIENFLTAHKDEVPGVLEAYQGKLSFDKYTFQQKGHNKDDIHSAPVILVNQP